MGGNAIGTDYPARRKAGSFGKCLVLAILVLVLVTLPVSGALAEAPAGVIPTFTIVSVVADQSVTIQTDNFPPNQQFVVTMGTISIRGIGGIVVATADSGAGSTFQATYHIPANLRGCAAIAIRLESPVGYYSYNWFFNRTTDADP